MSTNSVNKIENVESGVDVLQHEIAAERKDIATEGPAVSGVDSKKDVVNGQDEVDDLLLSLGF